MSILLAEGVSTTPELLLALSAHRGVKEDALVVFCARLTLLDRKLLEALYVYNRKLPVAAYELKMNESKARLKHRMLMRRLERVVGGLRASEERPALESLEAFMYEHSHGEWYTYLSPKIERYTRIEIERAIEDLPPVSRLVAQYVFQPDRMALADVATTIGYSMASVIRYRDLLPGMILQNLRTRYGRR